MSSSSSYFLYLEDFLNELENVVAPNSSLSRSRFLSTAQRIPEPPMLQAVGVTQDFSYRNQSLQNDPKKDEKDLPHLKLPQNNNVAKPILSYTKDRLLKLSSVSSIPDALNSKTDAICKRQGTSPFFSSIGNLASSIAPEEQEENKFFNLSRHPSSEKIRIKDAENDLECCFDNETSRLSTTSSFCDNTTKELSEGIHLETVTSTDSPNPIERLSSEISSPSSATLWSLKEAFSGMQLCDLSKSKNQVEEGSTDASTNNLERSRSDNPLLVDESRRSQIEEESNQIYSQQYGSNSPETVLCRNMLEATTNTLEPILNFKSPFMSPNSETHSTFSPSLNGPNFQKEPCGTASTLASNSRSSSINIAKDLSGQPVLSASSIFSPTTSPISRKNMGRDSMGNTPTHLPCALTPTFLFPGKSPWHRVPGDPDFQFQQSSQHHQQPSLLKPVSVQSSTIKPTGKTTVNSPLPHHSSVYANHALKIDNSINESSVESLGERNKYVFYPERAVPHSTSVPRSRIQVPEHISLIPPSNAQGIKKNKSYSFADDPFNLKFSKGIYRENDSSTLDPSLSPKRQSEFRPTSSFAYNPAPQVAGGSAFAPSFNSSFSSSNVASPGHSMSDLNKSQFSPSFDSPVHVNLPMVSTTPTPCTSPPSAYALASACTASTVSGDMYYPPPHNSMYPYNFQFDEMAPVSPPGASKIPHKMKHYTASTPPTLRCTRPANLPTPPIHPHIGATSVLSPTHTSPNPMYTPQPLKNTVSAPSSRTLAPSNSAFAITRRDFSLPLASSPSAPHKSISAKTKHPIFPTLQKESMISSTSGPSSGRLNDPPDLKKVVEKYLRDGDQVTLEMYLVWISSLHPSAMQAYLKGLINLGIKLKAREMLAFALYHGLQGCYYNVQDMFESLIQIDLGIMDMINGTTVEAISFLIAYFLRDGVATPLQIEWLVHQYRLQDPNVATRLVGSVVAKLWSVVSPPEFFAVMHELDLHSLFYEPSKATIAFELAKFIDPVLVEKII